MAQIIKRGDAYTIRVSAGYDLSKKQIRRNMTWTPEPGMTEKNIKKELERQAVLFEERVASGQAIDSSTTFAAFVDIWMSKHAKKLAIKTQHEYKALLVSVNKAIGHIRMDRLTPIALMDFYDNLREKGIRRDLTYTLKAKKDDLLEAKKWKVYDLAKDLKGKVSERTVYAAMKGKPISKACAVLIAASFEAGFSKTFSLVNPDLRLSENTVLHYHRFISSVLQSAVEWQVIQTNPCSRVTKPNPEKKESRYLDEVEAKSLTLQLASETLQRRAMVLMLIYTGVRRGELCGLSWADIDFSAKVLHVRQQAQYIPELGVFLKDPKKNSLRSIKLPGVAIRILLEHKNAQKIEKENMGDQWQENDLVFPNYDGSLMNPDKLSEWFREFIKAQGLPQVNVHSLRHTNATLMIAGGTDIRTVSKRLGHAQTSTTMNIYSHAIKSADAAAADTLENIFEPSKQVIKLRKASGQNLRNFGVLKPMSHKQATK